MARPQKYTVDYFSHDASSSSGRTLTILFNNFGHDGISAWWQLLECISLTNNHVIYLRNPEDLEYLAAKLHFKPERLKEILDKLAILEAIDKELYQAGYIWCQNFVERLKPVYDSRKQELPIKPNPNLLNIINCHPMGKNETNSVSLPDNSVSLPDNPINSTDKTHTKLKETKLKKETKVKYNAENVKPIFYAFKEDGYADIIDFDNQFKKFCEYWFEGNKELKMAKLACHNWLDNARERQQKNGGHINGVNRGHSQEIQPKGFSDKTERIKRSLEQYN